MTQGRIFLLVLLVAVLTACAMPGSDSRPETQPQVIDEGTGATGRSALQQGAACETADIPSPEQAEVKLRFINRSGAPIRVLWRDLRQSPATLTEYTQLADGELVDQETFVGHEWVIEDLDGTTLVDYIAGIDEAQCVEIAPLGSDPDGGALQQGAACETADIPSPEQAEVKLRFINRSGAPIRVLWRDLRQSPATLIEYAQLADGESVDQETFVGHEWVIEDLSGATLVDYIAGIDEAQCVEITPRPSLQ